MPVTSARSRPLRQTAPAGHKPRTPTFQLLCSSSVSGPSSTVKGQPAHLGRHLRQDASDNKRGTLCGMCKRQHYAGVNSSHLSQISAIGFVGYRISSVYRRRPSMVVVPLHRDPSPSMDRTSASCSSPAWESCAPAMFMGRSPVRDRADHPWSCPRARSSRSILAALHPRTHRASLFAKSTRFPAWPKPDVKASAIEIRPIFSWIASWASMQRQPLAC